MTLISNLPAVEKVKSMYSALPPLTNDDHGTWEMESFKVVIEQAKRNQK